MGALQREFTTGGTTPVYTKKCVISLDIEEI